MPLLPLYFRLTSTLLVTLLLLTNSHSVSANPRVRSTFNTSQTTSQESQSTGEGTPPPDGKGTSRPLTSCPSVEGLLLPLVYGRGTDFTQLEQPTLLFYSPYEPEDISSIQIVIRDDSHQSLARYEVRSIERSGIIKVTLPYSLEINQNYEIILELYCGNQSNPEKVIVSWIQRKAPSETDLSSDLEPFEKYQLDRENQMWYDAIVTLADLHFTNPNDPDLNAAWEELLKSLVVVENLPEDLSNLQWLLRSPLVNSTLHPLEN